MEKAIASVLPALITGLVALMTLWLSMRNQNTVSERQRRLEIAREREKKRIQYFDPLIITAVDLLIRVKKLREELQSGEGHAFWTEAFKRVKDWDRTTVDKRKELAFRCNGYDAGPVITLYLTCLYFARAAKIRLELPFIQLSPENDKELLAYLSEVRSAFGGHQNLWEELHDSLGAYVTKQDGSIMNYREFCEQLIHEQDYVWFLRLLDFYRDAHMKIKVEIPRIVSALEELVTFSKRMSSQTQKDETLA